MKILSRPRGNAEEYGRWAVNPYKGCPNGCQYCYLKEGAWAKGLGGNTPVLKEHIVNAEHAYHVAMAEIIENRERIIKDGGLFMTFTSDPLISDNRDLMLSIAHDAILMDVPVTMLTKDATFLDLDSYEEKALGLDAYENWQRSIYFSNTVSKRLDYIVNPRYSRYGNNIAFGFTLTGHDELEPNASPNNERIDAMRRLTERGFNTWASIEPVIDFPSSYDMILEALDAGCCHFKIGLMTKKTKVCRGMYDRDACIEFIHDVMRVMEAGGGTATVYWKQSFRDFLGEEDFARAAIGYKNVVDKNWSMFKCDDKED